MRDLAGIDELPPPGIDGCGLPNHPLSLRDLARTAARLADPSGLEPVRVRALTRIADAMLAHPFMVAGSGRCCTAVMEALPRLVAKTGAEGVYLGAWRERGLGIVVKAEDGATRAAEVAFLALVEHLGAMKGAIPSLDRFHHPRLRNHAGLEVGHIAPAPGWPAA